MLLCPIRTAVGPSWCHGVLLALLAHNFEACEFVAFRLLLRALRFAVVGIQQCFSRPLCLTWFCFHHAFRV